MKLIKLEIQLPRKSGGVKIIKKAVALDKKAVSNISGFVEYVRQVCGLKGAYCMSVDGFNIADGDTVKILEKDTVYRLRIAKLNSKSKIIQISSSDLSSEEDDQSIESEQSSSESSVVIKKKSKKDSLIAKKKSKLAKNEKKTKRKQIIEENSDQSVDDSSSESSSVPALNHEKKSTPKLPPPKKDNLKFKQTIKPTKTPDQSIVLTPAQKVNLTRTLNSKFNKEIIDDDSQSSPSPVQVALQKPVKARRLQPQSQESPDSEDHLKLVKKQETAKPIPPVRKVPPAIRNKMNKSFEQHKQDQWLVLDKEKCKKWQEKGHQTICQILNKVRFKVIQFDEQRFIPVKSNWISGEVSAVDGKEIKLINVDEEGKGFTKEYKIPEVNMDELELWKPLATKQQIECFSQVVTEQIKAQKQLEVKQVPAEDKNSIEKMVCGQLNYYFSDKNYNTDFFMQMHANNHPQKYMKLSFMLNFPKIKKVIRDEEKLWQYLKQDEKYDTRNYEIDFQQRLIRKKHIVDPREAHKVQGVPQQNEKTQIIAQGAQNAQQSNEINDV